MINVTFDTPKFNQFNNIAQVWAALESGKTIYWASENYQLVVSSIESTDSTYEYQSNHFTCKNDKIISIRCISNYFGGLMAESEMSALFVK